jgi:hypothetical protein
MKQLFFYSGSLKKSVSKCSSAHTLLDLFCSTRLEKEFGACCGEARVALGNYKFYDKCLGRKRRNGRQKFLNFKLHCRSYFFCIKASMLRFITSMVFCSLSLGLNSQTSVPAVAMPVCPGGK